MLTKIKKLFKHKQVGPLGIVLAGTLMATTGLSWFGDQSFLLFSHTFFDTRLVSEPLSTLGAALGLGLFCIGTVIVAAQALSLVKIKTMEQTKGNTSPRVMILCASLLDAANKKIIGRHEGVFKFFRDKNDRNTCNIIFEGIVKNDLIKMDNEHINQELVLKAIHNNGSRLEKVVLIYTREMAIAEKEGYWQGQREIDRLQEWLQHYFVDQHGNQRIVIELHPGYVDRTSMQDYLEAIDNQIERQLELGVKANDIVVNITGGQVPASIGASMATLHNETRLMYLDGHGEGKPTYTYDVILKPQDN